jgi:hypothetical protein
MDRRPTDSAAVFLAVPALGLFALITTFSAALAYEAPGRAHSLVAALVGLARVAASVAIHLARLWHDLLGNLL